MTMLVLPYPPSTNNLYMTVGRKRIPTKECKAFKAEVGWIALAAGMRLLKGRVSLAFALYPRTPNKCLDLSNAIKAAEDALTGIAWEDDKQVWVIQGCRMPPDDKGARLEVRVELLGE